MRSTILPKLLHMSLDDRKSLKKKNDDSVSAYHFDSSFIWIFKYDCQRKKEKTCNTHSTGLSIQHLFKYDFVYRMQ